MKDENGCLSLWLKATDMQLQEEEVPFVLFRIRLIIDDMMISGSVT